MIGAHGPNGKYAECKKNVQENDEQRKNGRKYSRENRTRRAGKVIVVIGGRTTRAHGWHIHMGQAHALERGAAAAPSEGCRPVLGFIVEKALLLDGLRLGRRLFV